MSKKVKAIIVLLAVALVTVQPANVVVAATPDACEMYAGIFTESII